MPGELRRVFPTERPLPLGIAQSRLVNDLLQGYLFGFSLRIRETRRRELEVWFEFCTDFAVDVLSARRRHVEVFVRYLTEVKRESPAVIRHRLGMLSDFYVYAMNEAAVSRNPVEDVKR